MKIYPIINTGFFKAKNKKTNQKPPLKTKKENQYSKNIANPSVVICPVFVHKQTNGSKRKIESLIQDTKQLFLQDRIDETAELLADFFIQNGGFKGITKTINKANIQSYKETPNAISVKIKNSYLFVGENDIGLAFDCDNTQKKIKVTIENNKLKSYEAYNHKADGYNCSYSISYNY